MRILFALLGILYFVSASAVERIVDFHAALRIGADGSLTVTERIQAQVEGKEIRRGIIRDFPTDYRDNLGNRYRVPFELQGVTRDGAPEPYALSRKSNGVSIRIGDANVMLPYGLHTYEIRYRVSRVIGFFADHDELYWNVNGNGWTFFFENISAEVGLPAAVPASQLKVEAYTGPQGARERDYQAFTADGAAAFRTTRAMAPYSGLTIVVSFPKGIVKAPTMGERVSDFFKDNREALVALMAYGILALFLYWRWTLVGRDPRAGPSFPRYEAPPGIGPAGVRYVDRMGWDNRCTAAMFLGLGQRGFLKIRNMGGDYQVERSGKDVPFLPGEKNLASLLGGPGHTRVISRTYDPGVALAVGLAAQDMAAYFGERMFSTNRGSVFVGVVIAMAGLITLNAMDTPTPIFVTALVLSILTLVFFAKIMPAYSVEGRKLEDHVQGLRQYLSVAEKDELARMKAPPQTAEEFAKFLPYAVALGVEKTWADRFAATIGAAAVTAAVADYYVSSGNDRDFFSSGGFASGLGDMGNTISAASTAPGSSSGSSDSGGGGGGSSGGGGGGGGGSGW